MDEPLLSARQCRAARCWLGWTQRELAERTGLDKYTIMNIEMGRGEPRRATLLALGFVFFRAGLELDGNHLRLPPEITETQHERT